MRESVSRITLIMRNGKIIHVMKLINMWGKFLGYPNLLSRTHEFFQKSLIYYNERPDLMI